MTLPASRASASCQAVTAPDASAAHPPTDSPVSRKPCPDRFFFDSCLRPPYMGWSSIFRSALG